MTHFPHPVNKDIVKSSRIVTLPHWQGYGIGMKMSNTVCGFEKYRDNDIHATTTLPIRQSYLTKSPLWVLKSQGCWGVPKTGNISKSNRADVYLETHKFINDNLRESDIKPSYAEIPEHMEKKTNDHKLPMILERIKINKERKLAREKELEAIQKQNEIASSYHGNVLDFLGG